MQDLSNKITGNQLSADNWNESQRELINLITLTGLVPSSGDLTQVLKTLCVISNLNTFFTAGGTANVITLTPLAGYYTVTSYLNGTKARWIPTADNTGSVTLNVNGLGAKALVQSDGATSLEAGVLKGGGFAEATYDSNNDWFILSKATATDTSFGEVRLSTLSELSSPAGETSNVPTPDSMSRNRGYYEKSVALTTGPTTSSSTHSDVAGSAITLDNVVVGYLSQHQKVESHIVLSSVAAAEVELGFYTTSGSTTLEVYYYYSNNTTGNMVYAGRTINNSSPTQVVTIPSSAYNGTDVVVMAVGKVNDSTGTTQIKLSWASTDNVSLAGIRQGDISTRKVAMGVAP